MLSLLFLFRLLIYSALLGEQQFQRKNHEEWLVDKARKLSQIIPSFPLFSPLVSLAHTQTNTPYMHASLTAATTSSSDDLQLIREEPIFPCLFMLFFSFFFCKRLCDPQTQSGAVETESPKPPPSGPYAVEEPSSLNAWQPPMNRQRKHPSHSPS